MIDLIRVSDEVATALAEDDAVVALETTLVAHGFPAPDGVEVGLASEAAVRDAGATPATIGVLDGRIRIGLSAAELERFTPAARKLGPRDLAVCAVQGRSGRPRSAEHSPPPRPWGFASWEPGASAASTAAFPRHPMFPPISPRRHGSPR